MDRPPIYLYPNLDMNWISSWDEIERSIPRDTYNPIVIKNDISTPFWFSQENTMDRDISTSEATKSLLKKGSEEYFRVSSEQYSICPLRGGGRPPFSVRDYESILSEKGMEMFSAARKRFLEGDVKDTITNYRVERERSGSWYKDDASPFRWVNYENEGEIKGIICAKDNIHVTGMMQKLGDDMQTSTCIFIVEEDASWRKGRHEYWCLTRSGSVYLMN
jgi:hypothetical protein